MMTANETAPDARRHWKKLAMMVVPGGLLGAAFGYTMGSQIDTIFPDGKPDFSIVAAMAVALIYSVTGLFVLAGLINPRIGAKFLNVVDVEELEEQRGQLISGGLVMVAIGALLGLLTFAEPFGPVPALLAGEGALVLLAAVIAGSIVQARRNDEMTRLLGQEAGIFAFYLLSGLFGIWAGAAHLGLAAAPAPLDFITATAAAILIGAFYAVAKRGLLFKR